MLPAAGISINGSDGKLAFIIHILCFIYYWTDATSRKRPLEEGMYTISEVSKQTTLVSVYHSNSWLTGEKLGGTLCVYKVELLLMYITIGPVTHDTVLGTIIVLMFYNSTTAFSRKRTLRVNCVLVIAWAEDIAISSPCPRAQLEDKDYLWP